MKTKLLLAAVIAVTISNSYGQLLIYETFPYVDGGQNATNELIGKVYTPTMQAWIAGPSISSGSTTNDDIVASPFAAEAFGIPAQAAGAYFFRGGGNDPVLPFTSQTSGVIYWSALVKIEDWGTASSQVAPGSTGKQILSLTNSFTSTGDIRYPAALVVRATSTTVGTSTFQFGLSNEQVGASNIGTYITTPYSIGVDHFVVLSYNLATQVASLWVDPVIPTNGTMPVAGPDITHTGTSTSLVIADVAGFFIRLDSNANTPSTTVDEIRIAKSWAEVVGQQALSTPLNELASKINFYPNPAKNTLSFNSNDLAIDSILFYTVEGKEVLNIKNFTNNTLDISSLSKGIYSVRVTTQEGVLNKKIIVK